MQKIYAVLLTILMLSGTGFAEETTYSGWVLLNEDKVLSHEVEILDTQAAFEKFQEQLPNVRPTKRHPSPPNNDPLRNPKSIDLKQSRLVVVKRAQTISGYPKFVSQKETKNEIVVLFELGELPPEARPFGWGVYTGLLLPSGPKPIRVEFK